MFIPDYHNNIDDTNYITNYIEILVISIFHKFDIAVFT